MSTHRMHLKGPWECAWHKPASGVSTDDQDAPTRVKMPAEWRTLFGQRRGTVTFRRRFGLPTNLEPHERVFLIFDGIGGTARVELNGRPLGTVKADQSTAEFDITGRLQANNQLAVELEFDPDRAQHEPGGLWGPVAIEIRSDAE